MEFLTQIDKVLDFLDPVIRVLLAFGFFGFLLERGWAWLHRPRLSMCYDPSQRPNPQSRRGFTAYRPNEVTMVEEYVAVVRNEGRGAARSVEATIQILAWWDGNGWREANETYTPSPLVWSGSHQTRAQIPAEGRRELAVFVEGPVRGGAVQPALHLAVQAAYTSPSPPMKQVGPRKTRVRLEVTSQNGATDSCEIVLDWTPGKLSTEGDCVRSPC